VLLNFVVDFTKTVRSILLINPSQAERFAVCVSVVFLRKMLGTLHGPVWTQFLSF